MEAVQREFEFRGQDFRFIADLVHERTGIVLADHKQDMVYARIARRLRSLRFTTFKEYCNLLQSELGQDEMANFVNAITTNLTSFFREPHHFTHLREAVLKPLVNSTTEKKLRIWSSACSSGAEPYSIAMTCFEAIPDIARWDIKILATDIDTGMLMKSQTGEYSESELDQVPEKLRDKFAIPLNNGMIRMHDALKKIITFKQLNLIHEWPFKGLFDAVFCRNVVIYFNKDTQKQLFAQMADHIKPHGWLYIGHSETLHNISDQFNLIGKTIYQRVSK